MEKKATHQINQFYELINFTSALAILFFRLSAEYSGLLHPKEDDQYRFLEFENLR